MKPCRLYPMPVVHCFRRIQWLGFRYSRNPLYFCNGIKRYWTSWIYSASRSNHTCIWRNLGFPCIECKTDYWRICCLNQFIRLLHIYLTQFNFIHIFSFRYCNNKALCQKTNMRNILTVQQQKQKNGIKIQQQKHKSQIFWQTWW